MKKISHRLPVFLSGQAYEDRKREHRGDYAQEAFFFAGFMVRVDDTRQPKCVMFRELVESARAAWRCMEGQEKEWMGCVLNGLRAFDINIDQ